MREGADGWHDKHLTRVPNEICVKVTSMYSVELVLLYRSSADDLRFGCTVGSLSFFSFSSVMPAAPVAYRWTKMELALFLTALSKLGDDFAAISRTLGTKSESFIRDFYEEFKEKVGLDCLVK
ncbi:unnamed protein product [Dibothriocephalus latus]|uniref:SANT domain-containing protein n=1 Tax=Dibothriocephalus latus TaxID=60516 RepID=A0A3P7P2Z7_DIBLA|nr:unnamed protein product [Dibothriocephalus latus]